MRKLTGTLVIKVSKCLLIIMKEVKIFMKKAGIHEISVLIFMKK